MKTRYVTATLLTVMTATTLAACSGGGGGSSASSTAPGSTPVTVPLEGFDLTGTYRATGVECYNSGLTALTAAANLDAGYVETINVNANAYTSTYSSGGCTAQETGKIVYNSSAFTLATSNRQTTTSTLASCSMSISFTATLSSITPTSVSGTINHNGTPAGNTVSAVRNTSNGTLGIFSIIQRVGAATDLCFLIYQKL